MREYIKDKNGNVLGSTLREDNIGKTTLQDRNGNTIGFTQHGRTLDRNGNHLGNAAMLGTLIPKR
jgi:hypothetical protein